jgi:hypothetical protein
MIAVGLLYLALLSGQSTPRGAFPHQTPNLGGPDDLMVHRSQDKADDARRFADDFSRCAASRDRKGAVAALALTYGSAGQAKATHALASLADPCWGPMISAMSMQLSDEVIAGGMAEYFVLHPQVIDQLRQRYPASFTWPAETALESLGDCVVRQGDGAVRTLVASRVGSDAESAAVQALAPAFGQCVDEGQTVALEIGTVRQLLAFSLYRHIAAPPAAPSAIAAAAH